MFVDRFIVFDFPIMREVIQIAGALCLGGNSRVSISESASEVGASSRTFESSIIMHFRDENVKRNVYSCLM